ncbi:MAG: hypothetical protein JWQ09_250 [Segetibacter sp.]|nr:hypothetical protein [Segetibacter sp.]
MGVSQMQIVSSVASNHQKMFPNERKYLGKLMIVSLFFIGCGDSMSESSSFDKIVRYKGDDYEFFHSIPMAFNRDTIYPELWFRRLNVDGDNKRIIRFITIGDTTIFPLPNAVSNYTKTTCYSLQVDEHRYLWLEDNFGTTVFDVDLKIIVRVKNPKKILSEIAPTGIKNDITVKDIRRQLGVTAKSNPIILDSLKFTM